MDRQGRALVVGHRSRSRRGFEASLPNRRRDRTNIVPSCRVFLIPDFAGRGWVNDGQLLSDVMCVLQF